MVPLLSLMVSRSMGVDRPNSPPASTDEEKALRESEEEGWIVHRFLSEFQQLHSALKMVLSFLLIPALILLVAYGVQFLLRGSACKVTCWL